MSTIPDDRRTPYLYLVLASIACYALVLSVLSIIRYESFTASVYDLGIMIQTVWNTANGYILQDSVNMGYPMMRFWMAHWEFIYAPIALIYKLFSTPYTIFIVHTLFIAFGALPIYWLAREKLGNEISALIFAVCYLLYPAVHNGNLLDVHGVTFAAPVLIYAFYYLQKKNFKLFTLFGFIAIMCREDSALLLMMMGVFSFFILKEKKAGIVIVVLSFAWFFIWYERMAIRSMLGLPDFIIMEGAEAHWDHLSSIKNDPLYLIKFLAKKHNILYFVYLFGPLVFFSLLSPSTLLIAAPIFAINLLSSYYYTHDVEHHYSATITPFVFISAIYGINNLIKHFKNKAKIDRNILIISIVMLAFSLLFFFIKSNVFDIKEWKITSHHKVIKSVIKDIPQDASLTSTRKLAVHAAERHELYLFNDNVGKVDYILYDFYAPTVRLITRKSYQLPYHWPDNDTIRQVLQNRNYGIIRYDDGVCLFKKGADFDSGLRKLALANVEEINNTQEKVLESGIVYKGYNIHDQLSYYYQPEKLGKIYWKHAIHFTAFWEANENIGDSLSFIIKLQNLKFNIFNEHTPVYGVYPTSKWQAGDLIRDEIFWELPENIEPGKYQVYASVKDVSENFIYLFDIDVQ